MRRTSGAGSLGLILALSASARSGDDGPPPLIAPAEARPPAVVAPLRPVPNPSRGTTNLLRPRGAAPARPRLDPVPIEPADGPPPLDGPNEMRRAPDRAIGGMSRRRIQDADQAIPAPLPDSPPSLILEPSDGDSEPGGSAKKPSATLPKPSASARRRFGIPPAPVNRNRAWEADKEPSIRVEPRSDPAADAALKRRLESKIKEVVGDRARDVEVRVVDRNIVIRARADRFWNKRNVRRTIEGLPALSGYKARVEID